MTCEKVSHSTCANARKTCSLVTCAWSRRRDSSIARSTTRCADSPILLGAMSKSSMTRILQAVGWNLRLACVLGKMRATRKASSFMKRSGGGVGITSIYPYDDSTRPEARQRESTGGLVQGPYNGSSASRRRGGVLLEHGDRGHRAGADAAAVSTPGRDAASKKTDTAAAR